MLEAPYFIDVFSNPRKCHLHYSYSITGFLLDEKYELVYSTRDEVTVIQLT